MKKTRSILYELREHIPFTLLATLIAIILVVIFKNLDTEHLFHIIHPLHLFFSAIVSSAIFYKYKKNITQTLLVGAASALIIGSLSDIIFPYLGGLIFGLKTTFHLSVLEEPFRILSVTIVGSIAGIVTRLTKIPHFLHVFLSVFASLFYILAFSPTLTTLQLILTFTIIFIAVIIPCCISDIIFPMLFVKRK
jgi:hypothetical protein